jgi:hypothetical protein
VQPQVSCCFQSRPATVQIPHLSSASELNHLSPPIPLTSDRLLSHRSHLSLIRHRPAFYFCSSTSVQAMEDDILRSLCSNMPIQDLDLNDFDFDAFLNWESFQATDTSVGVQQKQVPALSAGKKRSSNGASQPRIKRQKVKHSHVCDVHQPPSSEPAVKCFGKWSRMGPYKGARCERMVATFVDGQLPVCAQHRAQVMRMTRCEAVLECGFPCNEIVPWKLHGYPLCEAHWSQGKCYFLELLPVEIRRMIYRYLIPDQPVPARWFGTRILREDRAPVSTAIFRVSKTIHEDVADLFYDQTTFDIDVTNEQYRNAAAAPSISMCYAKDERGLIGDYQMQLMLLEQQNRTPLARPRAAASRTTSSRPTLQKISATGVKYDFTPWQPSLSLRYFQRIRSFRINITFDTPKSSPSAGNSLQSAETILAEADRNLLCDYLHRLVERLVTNNQVPLRNLDISICVRGISDGDDAQANSKAIAHCQALINPIRRLRTRAASVVSLIRTGDGNREIDMLPVHPKEEDSINKFVQSCCAELTDLLVPPPRSPVLVQFGQLVEVVSQMGQHPFWRETDIEEIEFLLNNGRSAREANDIKAMMSVFSDVFDMLKKYNSDHQDFMKQMKQSFEKMRSNGKWR